MDSQRVDLKHTLNLMRTDFPMKANLPQSEPKTLERVFRDLAELGGEVSP